MATIDDIRAAVAEVLRGYDLSALGQTPGPRGSSAPLGAGVFADLDAAVAAAARAQAELVTLPLALRARLVDALRQTLLENNEALSREAVEESGIGNVADKVIKNRLAATKTPGPEDVEPTAYSDENGFTLVERAPYGVIGAITPTTNPISTITSNGIGMLSAGNAVVFNPHPAAKRVSSRLVTLFNEAIMREGGPANLLTTVADPTIESAARLMKHPGINILTITGGPAVVRSAMNSGKKAICAGPGNPPCVVDETADIDHAALSIVRGAGFDHNLVCICEKEILAVEAIADRLLASLQRQGAFLLTPEQAARLTALVIAEAGGPGHEGAANKAYVGKSPQVLGRAIGLEVPASARILLCVVDRDHPLVWTEQLMPFIPLVRMKNVDEAIDFAVEVEHGFRHTAMMHSHDVTKLSRMAKLMNCSLFVKNGPCYAGLGEGGAGFASFTIASPTGEGITRPRTFTRERRCTLVDSFRII